MLLCWVLGAIDLHQMEIPESMTGGQAQRGGKMSKAGIPLGPASHSCLGTGCTIPSACGVSGGSSLWVGGQGEAPAWSSRSDVGKCLSESPFSCHSARPISPLAVTLQSRGWGQGQGLQMCRGETACPGGPGGLINGPKQTLLKWRAEPSVEAALMQVLGTLFCRPKGVEEFGCYGFRP